MLKHLRSVPAASLIVATILTTACGRSSDHAASSPQISGGRVVKTARSGPALASAVALTTRELAASGRAYCSGTLIAPKVVITAAHCLVNNDGTPLKQEFFVSFGADVKGKVQASVAGAYVLKGYTAGDVLLAEGLAMDDLGLVELAEAAPPTARPATLGVASTALQVKDKVLLAGYGVTATRENNDTGLLRQVKTSVVRLSEAGRMFVVTGSKTNVLVAASLDGPARKAERGACAGDSGGPAYTEAAAGQWSLIGVMSFGTEMPAAAERSGPKFCVGQNGVTDIRSYREVIEAALAAVQTPSEIDPSTWRPVGASLQNL